MVMISARQACLDADVGGGSETRTSVGCPTPLGLAWEDVLEKNA